MLMSILIGISIIAVTVTGPTAIKPKRIQRHQSCAIKLPQMLAWSGVSTFRQYLLQKAQTILMTSKHCQAQLN